MKDEKDYEKKELEVKELEEGELGDVSGGDNTCIGWGCPCKEPSLSGGTLT